MTASHQLKKKIAHVVLFVAIAALAALLGFGIWKGRERTEKQVQDSATLESDMKLTDMEYTEMEEGRRLWTIRAVEARYFEKEQRTHLITVRLVLFTKDGREVHLKSREGLLHAGAKDIDLWGDIQATVPQGYVLTSETAAYRHAPRTISSESSIHVSGSDLQLTGDKWVYRIADQLTTIEGNIKATLIYMPHEASTATATAPDGAAPAEETAKPATETAGQTPEAKSVEANGQDAAIFGKPDEDPDEKPTKKTKKKHW